MSDTVLAKIYRESLHTFVEKAFRSTQGKQLSSSQPYISCVVLNLERLMRGDTKKLLLKKTSQYSFPIIYGADFGHISPILTLPIGCRVTLSHSKNSINIIDTPFI